MEFVTNASTEAYHFQAMQRLAQQAQLDGQAPGLGQSPIGQNTLANQLWTDQYPLWETVIGSRVTDNCAPR